PGQPLGEPGAVQEQGRVQPLDQGGQRLDRQQLAAPVPDGGQLYVAEGVGAVEPLQPGELAGGQADELPADAELVEQDDGERVAVVAGGGQAGAEAGAVERGGHGGGPRYGLARSG